MTEEKRYPTGRLPSRPHETVLQWLERTDRELKGEKEPTYYLVFTAEQREGGEIFGVFSSVDAAEAAIRAEYKGSDESGYQSWRDIWTFKPITIDVPFKEQI